VAIAEKHGGHLLASSRDEVRGEAATRPASSLSLRVPSAELTAVLAELSRLAAGALSERITADDVSDEVVDLEARLRNQRRLEEQLLTLLQSARDVEAALKVHHELSAARGEIERLEGQRTFLERTVSFATIELSLSELPVAQVSTGFPGDSLARAEHDAVRLGQGIVTGVIRLCGVLLPVALLIVLPSLAALWLLHRWSLRRRFERGTFPST
jgi:hypothetical protein